MNIEQVDITICPNCGNIIKIFANRVPETNFSYAKTIYIAECSCGFKAENMSEEQLLKSIDKVRNIGPNYKIIETFSYTWVETRTVVDTANTFDEAMQKIKEYKTACGEDRILSVELISKDLQE